MKAVGVANNYIGSELIRQKKQKKRKKAIEMLIRYTVIVILVVIFTFQYVYMISKSLMGLVDANAIHKTLFPVNGLHFENYKIIIDYLPYLRNTLTIVIINMVVSPFISALTAYPLARSNFKGRRLVFSVMLAATFIPAAVSSVPTYTLFARLGLVDNIASQFIGSFFGGGFSVVFLIMQFMKGIPKELDNAAKIDGANSFVIFFRLIFPLCFNILLYLGIGSFIGGWMDFQGPLIYLHSREKFTLAVAFYYDFSAMNGSNVFTQLQMAMGVMLTIVPAVIYIAFQKNMIGAIQIGALKG